MSPRPLQPPSRSSLKLRRRPSRAGGTKGAQTLGDAIERTQQLLQSSRAICIGRSELILAQPAQKPCPRQFK
jgi:hypothetical protein